MKQVFYFLMFFLIGLNSIAQNCKSLTWHTPNTAKLEMTEENPLSIPEDSIVISLNWDCNTLLTTKDFVVFIDDIAEITTHAKIREIKGRTFITTLYLSPGKHKVVVKAANVSSPEIWIQYTGKPDLYIFSVGVPNELAYTTQDAADIVKTFEQLRGKNLFGEVFAALYNNVSNTSKSDIKGGLTELYAGLRYKYIREWDFITIYLSSSGFVENGTFYFSCKGYTKNASLQEYHTISSYELLEILSKIPCKKLLVIDAPYSETFILNVQKANMLSNQNLSVLVSCQKDQMGYENEKWKNGAFTEAFLQAFEQGKADKNKDGIIYLKEIADFVIQNVPFLLKNEHITGTQNPVFWGEDMPLYIYEH